MSVRHSCTSLQEQEKECERQCICTKKVNKMETVFCANSKSVLKKEKGPLEISCVVTCVVTGQHVLLLTVPVLTCAWLKISPVLPDALF